MSLSTALKVAISLVNLLFKIAHDKQLLDAGEYKAIAKANNEALKKIRAADAGRRNPVSMPDDPNNRDRR